MIGRYDHFPINIQGVAEFAYQTPTTTLQQTITQLLQTLNNKTIEMKTITQPSPLNCSVNFEFGLADGDTFNFLDAQELRKLAKTLEESTLETLDFYCAIRYHTTEPTGKRKPMKFDYKMLRFKFKDKNMQLAAYHERGNQNIPIDDLFTFLQKQINRKLVQTRHRTLTLKHIIKSQKALSLQQP